MRFTYHTEEQWAELIRAGHITLNGEPPEPTSLVKRDDTITYTSLEHTEPDLPTHFHEIYADDDFLIVSKPAGVPVHATAKIFRNTLTGILRRHYCEDEIAPLHRIDRDTSGLIVFTRSRDASSRFGKYLGEIFLRKWYLALVHGNPSPAFAYKTPTEPLASHPSGTPFHSTQSSHDWMQAGGPLPPMAPWPPLHTSHLCQISLLEQSNSPIRDQMAVSTQGKACQTQLHWLGEAPLSAAWPDKEPQAQANPPPPPVLPPLSAFALQPSCTNAHWVLAELLTGRKHQIRAHLSALGHPIVGDRIYSCEGKHYLTLANGGTLSPADIAELGAPRQCLHSWRALLQLPGWPEPRILEAPIV